jgi:hypothetical protein
MAQQEAKRVELEAGRTRALLLSLDGMSYAAGICVACHRRALEQLRRFEGCPDLVVPNEEAMLVLADVWGIVDAAHRFRILLQRAPNLSKREGAIRIFLRYTSEVEVLRHYVQHLDGEISKARDGSPPLWGIVSWTKSDDPLTYFQLITGNVNVKPSYQGLVFDTVERRFTRNFELHAGTTSIDLDNLVKRVKTLDRVIRSWSSSIGFSDGSAYQYAPPRLPLMNVSFRLLPVSEIA